MSTQEAYEKMRDWFSRPNAKFGYDQSRGACVYRGGADRRSLTRCAVGCLIPNRLYNPGWEGGSIDTLVGSGRPVLAEMGLEGVDFDFLNAAQSAHDSHAINSNPISRFLEELKQIARNHGLEV